jgi:hypothetical protein
MTKGIWWLGYQFYTLVAHMTQWRSGLQEVLVAVLVARLREVVLSHDVVVGVIPPPRELFPLFGNSSFFLTLPKCQLDIRTSDDMGIWGQRECSRVKAGQVDVVKSIKKPTRNC